MITLSQKVSIISGPVGSGKTSRLIHWLDGREAFGFLSPILNHKRVLQNVATHEIIPFETRLNDETINIGRYSFDPNAFDAGGAWLMDSIINPNSLIIIDEIGKLELDNKGFGPYLHVFFEQIRTRDDLRLIIIIRDYLLDAVISEYKLNAI